MTARKIDFWDALRYRNQLRSGLICSESWLETVVAYSANAQSWIFDPNLYPPGGSQTLMRECSVCGRVCPPNGAGGSPCCDCEAEAAELAFREWVRQPSRAWLKGRLLRIWWRVVLAYDSDSEEEHWYSPGSISYAEFKEPPRPRRQPRKRQCLWCGREQLESHELGSEIGMNLGKVRRCKRCKTILPNGFFRRSRGATPMSFPAGGAMSSGGLHEGNAFYFDPADGIPPSVSVGDQHRTAVRIATDRMNPRKERGRSPGCQILLLPESAARLREEIEYFENKWRDMSAQNRRKYPYSAIMPSAKRYSRPMPYRPAPEDFGSGSWLWSSKEERAYYEALEADDESGEDLDALRLRDEDLGDDFRSTDGGSVGS